MVIIEASYDGGLRTTNRHQPSGCELVTDAPVDNHGLGESFSPTDLLAAALASCMVTVMGIEARKRDWPLEGTRAVIEKHMGQAPRRVSRVVISLEMSRQLPPEAQTPLEEIARTCPVAQSIHPDVEVDLRFDWGA